MQFLKNIPLKRKLILVLMTASMAALLLGALCFFSYQWVIQRDLIRNDLSVLGEVGASNARQFILKNDVAGAQGTLKSLTAKPGVIYANLNVVGRGIFASYGTFQGISDGPHKVSKDGLDWDGSNLTLRQPIMDGVRRLGTLLIVFDYDGVQKKLVRFHLIAGLGISAILVTLAFYLSSRLHRVVLGPIIDLVETARVITEKKDYSVRAGQGGKDEIGQFIEAFNRMLEQIERQDTALQKAPIDLSRQVEALQHEISERKRVEESLRAAEVKYRSLVEQLPVITYNSECGETGVWFYVSPQIEAILGYTPEEWVADGNLWKEQIHPEDRENIVNKAEHMIKSGDQFIDEYRMYDRFGRVHWFRDQAVIVRDPVRNEAYTHGFLLDVTEQKQAEMELDTLQQQLLDISRQAGMAEVATGVLHNVGNVLNSVNVSSTLLGDLIKNSKLASFSKVTTLLRENSANLGDYITSNPKGKLLPTYLVSLTEHLTEEHVDMLNELAILTKNIEHIKDIVSMQQSYAKVSGMVEAVSVKDIVDDALQINSPTFNRSGIKITRTEPDDLPPVAAEKHKVLQILVNLFRNAKNAMEEVPRKDRKLAVTLALNGNNKVKISIKDQGMGIARENLIRIFSHGFTTKTDGHGFGLHIGALAAQEMGGSLTADSEGPGKGATFTLELPIATQKAKS